MAGSKHPARAARAFSAVAQAFGLCVAQAFSLCLAQSWQPLESGVNVSLRGVSAVNANLAFASGAQGAILKTTDGGATWRRTGPAGVADLDFRDLEAVSETTVFAMSAGAGPLSRVYKTTDGGATWTLARVNGEQGFWDAIAFWDQDHGILLGDPVNGRFTILTTADGGRTWQQREGPRAERGEAAFAASGTALVVRGAREAWFATGGAAAGRVFHTEDGGATWSAARTSVRAGAESAGIFSLAFRGRFGLAAGGDYTRPDESAANLALTEDGGRSWKPAAGLRGYRSAIVYASAIGMWIATGPPGTEWSEDGRAWHALDGPGYHALSAAADGSVWAVGAEGRIARWVLVSH
jgi:photosystem II stability/assembly factor-like uncharacterized protein